MNPGKYPYKMIEADVAQGYKGATVRSIWLWVTNYKRFLYVELPQRGMTYFHFQIWQGKAQHYASPPLRSRNFPN